MVEGGRPEKETAGEAFSQAQKSKERSGDGQFGQTHGAKPAGESKILSQQLVRLVLWRVKERERFRQDSKDWAQTRQNGRRGAWEVREA